MSRAQAVEITKWSVGPAACPPPDVETLDEDALAHLSAYHRIEARLLARLETARPAWCPPRFLTRLRIRQHTVRQQVAAHIEAAREMSRAMRKRGLAPPIFIKGFGAYALTANPDLLHLSGDLDTFAEDKEAFWDVLHDIGYTGKRKDTYEWAKLRRPGVTLDIHRHFPMVAYPPEVRTLPAARMDARQNPGHWPLPALNAELVHSPAPLLWDDLAPDAAGGTAAGTGELLFPSPTLLCLIHCSHCFRSLITRLHYLDPGGGFRLCELLSIAGLAQSPGFHAGQFMALVEKFAAQDSVHLVNTLAAAFLGVRALPEPEQAGAAAFPEQLVYGGWVSLQDTEDWLWPPGITEMIQQLGARPAPAVCRLDTWTTARLLTQGIDPPSFQIALDWNAAQKSLGLDWAVSASDTGLAEHELLVHFGYGSVIKTRLGHTGEVVSVSQKSDYGQMNAHAAAASVSGAVRLTCAVPTWPDADTAPDNTLPLFLAVRRLSSDGTSTEAASYFPLQLVTG